MTSVAELFPKSRKLAYDSKQLLSQVQNSLVPPSELFLSLDELTRQLDIMERLVLGEAPEQREVWRRKILELREDANSTRRQGQHHDRMVQANARLERERSDLLIRRRRRQGPDDQIHDLTDESESLRTSASVVGELLHGGQAQLASLVDQRNRMRGVKCVLLDIGNKIGLSNSTMRIIERRDFTDSYIVFGGMFTTLIVLYIVWLR